ncbi:hypothetical protein COE51_01360 [Bacillus pseudomycoides]|nr:hypothetical protein COE51_01360 [Bacillus pseudomycoides]
MNPNYKFMMWDWDECKYCVIPKENIVEAIYYAWNYEFDVHEIETEELIFTGQETNEFNSEALEKYGLRLIDGEKYRQLQNIETGELYKADWQ